MELRLPTPFRSFSEHRQLQTARRLADEQLIESRLPSPRLAWRVAELLAEEHRIGLGRSLTDVVHAADERLLPGAKPVDRGAVRENRAQLLDLAASLFDAERSVRPRGVLMLERLLRDGSGPLYGRDAPRKLRLALAEIREALGA
jgi:hypothetical protein